MADFGIYTKNADIQALVGINAGTDAKAVTQTDVYVLNVEAAIDVETGFDWSTAWTAGNILDETLRNVLIQTGAAGCAMNVIIADPTGYSAREREMTLDYLNSMYLNGIKIIKEKDGAAMMRGEK